MKPKWKEIDDFTLVMEVPGGLLYRVSTLESETVCFVPATAIQSDSLLRGLEDAFPE